MKKTVRILVATLLCLTLSLAVCLGFSRETKAEVPEFGFKVRNIVMLYIEDNLVIENKVVKIPSGKGWHLEYRDAPDKNGQTDVELVLDNYKGGRIQFHSTGYNDLVVRVVGRCELTTTAATGLDCRNYYEGSVNLTLDLQKGDLIINAPVGIWLGSLHPFYGASTDRSVLTVDSSNSRHNLIINADSAGIELIARKDKTQLHLKGKLQTGIHVSDKTSRATGIVSSAIVIADTVALGISTPDRKGDYAMSCDHSEYKMSSPAYDTTAPRYGNGYGKDGYFLVFPKEFYNNWKSSFDFFVGDSFDLGKGETLCGVFHFDGEEWAKAAGLTSKRRAYNLNSPATAPQSEEIPCNYGTMGGMVFEAKYTGDFTLLFVEDFMLNGKTILSATDFAYVTVGSAKLKPITKVNFNIKSIEIGKSLPKATVASDANYTVSTVWTPKHSAAGADTLYEAEITIEVKEGYTFTDSTEIKMNNEYVGYNIVSPYKIKVWFQRETGHNISSKWTYDSNNHWKACSGCSQKFNLAAHTIKTEYTNGGKTLKKTCTVCGWTSIATSSAGTIDKVFLTFPLPVAGDYCWWSYYTLSEKGFDTSKFRASNMRMTGAVEHLEGDTANYFNDDYWRYCFQLTSTEGKLFRGAISTADIIFEKFDKSLVVFRESVSVSPDCKTLTYDVTIHPISNWLLGVTAKKVTPGTTKYKDSLPTLTSLTSNIAIFNMGYTSTTWLYKDGVEVYKETNNRGTVKTSGSGSTVITEGSQYLIICSFNVGDSYQIDNYKIKDAANAIISGSVTPTQGYFMFLYDFSTIDRVSLIELNVPKTGEKPNNSATSPDERYGLAYGAWETKDTVFQCDTDYTYVATVVTSGDQKFASEKNLEVTINGKKAKIISRTDTQLDISVTYNSGSHKYGEWTVVTPATCDTAGQRSRSCTACGKTVTDTIPATGHIFVFLEGSTPNCVDEGSKDRYTCQTCGLLTDEEAENPTPRDEAFFRLAKDPSNHVGGPLTYNRKDHWTACACGAELDREPHTFGEDKICTVCGYEKGTNPNKKADDTEGGNSFGDTMKKLLTLWWFWLIIAALLIAILITLIVLLKKKNNDDNEPDPEDVIEENPGEPDSLFIEAELETAEQTEE